MNREVVRIAQNTPVVVKLDFGPEGIERPSKYGDGVQYQYTLNDDCAVMWLPSEGRNAVIRSGAEAGDSIRILKSARGFDVRVVSDAGEPGPETQPEPAPAPQRIHTPGKLPAKLYESNVGYGAPKSQPQQNAAPRPAPTPQPRTETWPLAEVAKTLFRVAVDVWNDAREYAAHKGITLEPTSEDVRALGISFMIDRTKNGGNR